MRQGSESRVRMASGPCVTGDRQGGICGVNQWRESFNLVVTGTEVPKWDPRAKPR